MDNNELHIIAFDVPFPPNYGGIADVFYKLKSLHEAGAKITYHCFYYEGHNPPTKELEKYCHKLYYYERKKSYSALLLTRLPYVIASRNDTTLLLNLMANPAPILMDGIQCTYWILHEDIRYMGIMYRANNIEHEYYEGLANVEKNFLKRWYLRKEAKKLANFEWQIRHADHILSVAKQDIPHFNEYAETHHVPPFFDDTHTLDFSQPQPKEKFVLFQGNLSVKENENAAEHIIKNIAAGIESTVVIAGKSPSKGLKQLAASVPNVSLVDTPSSEEMARLIREAQVHLLLTFQQTGIKLKLLHALQSGRHIVINSFMDDDGIFSEMCTVANQIPDIAENINALLKVEFTEEMKKERDTTFQAIYSNKKKADDIMELVAKLHKKRTG